MAEIKRGLRILGYGDTDTGKTYFGFTCPKIIECADTELRDEQSRLLQFKADPKIHVRDDLIELKDKIGKGDELIDEVESLTNFNRFVANYYRDLKAGKTKGGTMMIDSLTDLWQWRKIEAITRFRKASKNPDAFEMQPFHWDDPKSTYWRTMMALSAITQRYPVTLYATMRENIPQSDHIKAHMDKTDRTVSGYLVGNKQSAFFFDIILRFHKSIEGGRTKHLCTIDKLYTYNTPPRPIENFTYKDLTTLLNKLKAKQGRN